MEKGSKNKNVRLLPLKVNPFTLKHRIHANPFFLFKLSKGIFFMICYQELIPVLYCARCQTLAKCFVDAFNIMQYAAGMTNTSC